MPDRLRKYPKRDQRIGHQWFRPTFDQTALKYFRLRGVEAISLGEKAAKFHDPMTHVEVALHYMQKTGMKVPPADKPKLLVTLEKKLAGTSSESDGAGKKEKKKKQKK